MECLIDDLSITYQFKWKKQNTPMQLFFALSLINLKILKYKLSRLLLRHSPARDL